MSIPWRELIIILLIAYGLHIHDSHPKIDYFTKAAFKAAVEPTEITKYAKLCETAHNDTFGYEYNADQLAFLQDMRVAEIFRVRSHGDQEFVVLEYTNDEVTYRSLERDPEQVVLSLNQIKKEANEEKVSVIWPGAGEPTPPHLLYTFEVMGWSLLTFPSVLDCKKPAEVVMLGFGGGTFYSFLTHYMPSWNVEVIEYVSEFIQHKEMFGIHTNSDKLKIQNAHDFIFETPKTKYDAFIVDVQELGQSPSFILEAYYLRKIAMYLSDNGILVMNYVSNDVAHSFLKMSFLTEIFKNVYVIPIDHRSVIIVAHFSPTRVRTNYIVGKVSQLPEECGLPQLKFGSSLAFNLDPVLGQSLELETIMNIYQEQSPTCLGYEDRIYNGQV